MKTITVKIPPDVDAKLECTAAQLKKTKSVLVRLAIQELLNQPDLASKLSAFDMLSAHCGSLDKLPRDLSHSSKHMISYGK